MTNTADYQQHWWPGKRYRNIQMREIIKAKEHIARMIASPTGKAIEIVRADIERDYWMDAEEAIQYGLVSKIIEHPARLRG